MDSNRGLRSFILWQYLTNAARILDLQTVEARSHFYFHEALLKSLVKAGHEVTFINPYFTSKDAKNLTLIQIPASKAEDKNPVSPYNDVAVNGVDTINLYQMVLDLGEEDCEKIMKMPFILNLLNSPKNRFDVVFVEQFFMYECLLPIVEKLEVPIIGLFSGISLSVIDFYYGNPFNPAVHPLYVTNFPLKMTFFQRLQNVYYYLLDIYMSKVVIKTKLKKFYDKYFPSFDLEKCRKVSLTFLNANPSFYPRPTVPGIINVAGVHVEMASKELIPEDIRKFIEEARHGVILFSLGSIISGPALTAEQKAAFKEAFAQIPQRVIWKFDEKIPGLSDNVLMSKWVPQKEILGHPNVLALMSHCGMMSTYEAVYIGKPMILVPIFADQPGIAARLVELEVGLLLDIKSFTKDDLVKLIKEIVNNPKYTQYMRMLSNTMKDVPISPANSVVYWTEYVLRHNGAEHLRTVAADMPLYQYLLLDVMGFLAIAFIASVLILICLCKKIYRTLIPQKVRRKITFNKKKR